MKRAGEVTGSGQFYQDLNLDFVPNNLDKDIVIMDATVRSNENGEFVLMAVASSEKAREPEYLLLSRHQVIVSKVKQLIEQTEFPVLAMFTKGERYYDMN